MKRCEPNSRCHVSDAATALESHFELDVLGGWRETEQRRDEPSEQAAAAHDGRAADDARGRDRAVHVAQRLRQRAPRVAEDRAVQRHVAAQLVAAFAAVDRAARERALVLGKLDLVHCRARAGRRRIPLEHAANEDLGRHRRDVRPVFALRDQVPRARDGRAVRAQPTHLDEHSTALLAELQRIRDAVHRGRQRRERRQEMQPHAVREHPQAPMQERGSRRGSGPNRTGSRAAPAQALRDRARRRAST